MKSKFYEKIGERLFTDILPNGLTVYYLPKADYNRTYGLFTTNFGSLDTSFVPLGESEFQTFPEGIAHFLEHKLLKKKRVMSCISLELWELKLMLLQVFQGLRTFFLLVKILMNVQNFYLILSKNLILQKKMLKRNKELFNKKSKCIKMTAIGVFLQGFLEKMYPDSPLAADIAGTPATINAITADDLYKNYEVFYHPKNMNLFLTGPFDIEMMSDFVRSNQAKKTLLIYQKFKEKKLKRANQFRERVWNLKSPCQNLLLVCAVKTNFQVTQRPYLNTN